MLFKHRLLTQTWCIHCCPYCWGYPCRRWLKSAVGDSLKPGAVEGAAAAVLAGHALSINHLASSLTYLLQALPAQQLAAARSAGAPAGGHGSASPTAAGRAALAAESPAELLELQLALVELLPTLCKLCARAVSKQDDAAAAAAAAMGALSGFAVGSTPEQHCCIAVLLELLKEILLEQLQPPSWRNPVLRHLDLVPMLRAVAARANIAAAAALGSGSSEQASVAVSIDTSVLQVVNVSTWRASMGL